MNIKLLESLIRNRDFKSLKVAINSLNADQIVAVLSDLAPAQAVVVFRLLDKSLALGVFEALAPTEQTNLIAGMEDPEIGELLSTGDPADLAALLEELPAKVVRRVTSTLSRESRESVQILLGYPADTVGRIIDPRYILATTEEPVRVVLDKIRESNLSEEDSEVVFVVAEGRKYVGYAPLARLLRADGAAPIGSIPLEAESVLAYEPIRHATERLTRLRLPILAVVDSEGRLVGSLRAADALEIVEEEEASRLVQFGGALAVSGGPDIDLRATPAVRIFSARFFWLAILTVFGIMTSTFVAQQEAILDKAMIPGGRSSPRSSTWAATRAASPRPSSFAAWP